MTDSHVRRVEGNSSGPDVGAAFEKFLKAPWPLPDSQMSERRRLWLAFDAGAQFVIEHLRVAIPLRDVQSDDLETSGKQA